MNFKKERAATHADAANAQRKNSLPKKLRGKHGPFYYAHAKAINTLHTWKMSH
jgi:hypothetical protein